MQRIVPTARNNADVQRIQKLFHGSATAITGHIQPKRAKPICRNFADYVFATGNRTRAVAYAFKTAETYSANSLNLPPVPFLIYISQDSSEELMKRIPPNGFVYDFSPEGFQENIVDFGEITMSTDEWFSPNPVNQENVSYETIGLENALAEGLQIFHIQGDPSCQSIQERAQKFLNELHIRMPLAESFIRNNQVTHLNPLFKKKITQTKILNLAQCILT